MNMLLTITLEQLRDKKRQLHLLKKVHSVLAKRNFITRIRLQAAKRHSIQQEKRKPHFNVKDWANSIQRLRNFDPNGRMALGLSVIAPSIYQTTVSKRCQILSKAAHIAPIERPHLRDHHWTTHPQDLMKILYMYTAMLKPMSLSITMVDILIHMIVETQLMETYVQQTMNIPYIWPTTRMLLEDRVCSNYHPHANIKDRATKVLTWGEIGTKKIYIIDDFHKEWCAAWTDQFHRQAMRQTPQTNDEQDIHKTIRDQIPKIQAFLKERTGFESRQPRPIRPENLLRHI